MATGTRLALGAAIVLGVTGYMAFVGASSSWQYYLTVDECLAQRPQLLDARIRVSGSVAAASLRVAPDGGDATFLLQGSGGTLSVRCSGPLPDNLAEGREVVVEGQLRGGCLVGDRVLTRCASKYSSQAPPDESARYPSRSTP
jgi:cytochrome c-type biogenesis protein CcmE